MRRETGKDSAGVAKWFLEQIFNYFLREKTETNSSLRGFLSSFNCHLKACKYPKNIMEDLEFEQTRKALETRSRHLKKEGKGQPRLWQTRRSKFCTWKTCLESRVLRLCWTRCGLWTPFISLYERLRRASTNDLGRCSTYQRCGRNWMFWIFQTTDQNTNWSGNSKYQISQA